MTRKDLNNIIERDRYIFHRYTDDFERRFPKIAEGIRWAVAIAFMALAVFGIYHIIGMIIGVW